MIAILNTLFPVFSIVALAYWLGRRGSLSRTFMAEMNWLVFRISLPALIVHSLATAPSLPGDTLPVLGIFLLSTLGVIALSMPVCRWLQLPRERVGTFIQAAFRGNLAYTGLPIVVFALDGQPPEAVASTVAQVLFVLAPSMLLYNIMAVVLLVGSHQGFSADRLPKMLRAVAINPLILASVIGVILFFSPWDLPRFILNTLDLMGRMAAPAALFCVGGAMAFVPLQGRYRSAAMASALKVVVLPAIAAGLLLFVRIEPSARLVLLILSACPTAVASYIMARELHGDEALAAGSILLSTVACIPVLAAIIAWHS